MALDHGPDGTQQGEPPEAEYPDVVLGSGHKPGIKALGAGAGTVLAGGALAWGLRRRRQPG
jgi:hypothetical protein